MIRYLTNNHTRDIPLIITDQIHLLENEINETFIHSNGPGGQNVNKVATSVQLKFNINRSTSLPDSIKRRLIRLAGKRISTEGILMIEASRFRSQDKNREDARNRLRELILEAMVIPKKRFKTRPSMSARQKRIDQKKNRGKIKMYRKKVNPRNET